MKATMSDYGLLPSSNLLTEENKVRLFHYWNALRAEWIAHLINHGEALPAAQINKRLELEFSMNIDRLGELWAEGAEIVDGPMDDTDEEILDEIDQEIADDLLEFVKMKLKQQEEEEMLFRSIVSEI